MRYETEPSRPTQRTLLSAIAIAIAIAIAAAVAAPRAAAAPDAAALARDVELARRLGALLEAPDDATTWSISIEAVLVKDGPVRQVRLWSDGLGIWDRESQFRLDRKARQEILKAYRDNGFCNLNDELYLKGSGARRSPNVLVRQHAITLEIGGVSKTVAHVVSSFGIVQDVEDAANSLRKIVEVVRKACEGPAAEGVRAKDLADGLSKVATGKLGDVAFRVSVNRPEEPGGTGWMTHVDGRRVTTRTATKGQGWLAPVELLLTNEELVTLVRALAAANPGALPQNVYDEGYTDLVVSVLNRSVTAQARPFAGMDPKANEGIRKSYRAVVAEVRKLHEKALREGKTP